MAEPGQPHTPGGRRLITRADMAHISGASMPTLHRWYAEREHNHHPEPVHTEGRRLFFDEQQWRQWHAAHLAAKKATLTTVDRTGDPDELIDVTEFARVLGYSGNDPGATIRAYVRNNPGYLPDPDHTEQTPTGRIRRYWHRHSAWKFADSRDKRGGARPVTDEPPPRYSTHPLIDAVRAALAEPDPPTAAQLARQLGINERTAQRLVKAARTNQ
ncbi:hypothetical protein GCM10023321_72500 [Pseudonocardia eucalypti]|uniref:MerR-like DNA binding protein n=1 Tax=Pseudonocardia eucalypti TaxID=648755 RepID=A0ABP9R6X7_9PSEU|nr:putative DNA-binding transcriptional regulator AlpA [Pseudonocardia eucalypti]